MYWTEVTQSKVRPVELGYVCAVIVIYLQTVPNVPSGGSGHLQSRVRVMVVGIPGDLNSALLTPRAQQMFSDNGVLASPSSSLPCDRAWWAGSLCNSTYLT